MDDHNSEQEFGIAEVASHLAAISQTVLSNSFDLVGKTFMFSGSSPYFVEDLVALLPPGVAHAEDETPEGPFPDYVVLGRDEFDEDLIQEMLVGNDDHPLVLPQEAFVDLVLFGHDWWHSFPQCLHEWCEFHPGLQFVGSLESFPWPGTDAPESNGTVAKAGDFEGKTPLRRTGYDIWDQGRKRTRPERWGILTRKSIPELGLKEVVDTIANHCRTRKAQNGGREKYSYGIGEWEHDLSRLREEVYQASRTSFRWPSTEPFGR